MYILVLNGGKKAGHDIAKEENSLYLSQMSV